MDGVPTMYLYMLSHPDFGNYDLSSLRTAVVGGQAMPPAKQSNGWSASARPFSSCGA